MENKQNVLNESELNSNQMAEDNKNDIKLESNKNAAEDEGEDLPENFFDDFSNNDFMAGLDIVDDWEDEDNAETKTDSSSLSQKKEPEKRRHSRSPGKYKDKDYRHKMSHEARSKEDDRSRYSGRSRDYLRRRKSRDLDRRSPRKRSKERQERHKPIEKSAAVPKPTLDLSGSSKNSEELIDTRRDPEKTKRDIQRDKIRCAKDFEARVLQEQLKVAESGLFPPGTELDVVLEIEKKKAEALVNETLVKETLVKDALVKDALVKEVVENVDLTVKKPEKHKIVERSPRRSLHKRRSLRRSRSPRRSRSIRRSRSPRRLRSPEYRSRKRIFTRLNRSRDRSFSPRRHYRRMRSRSTSLKRRSSRSLDRDELLRRNDDLRLQIRAKRRERYVKDLSPVSESKFSRSRSPSNMNLSAISKISDRELWLRNRDRYKQRYGCSISPNSFSSVDAEGGSPRSKRSKKNSFLKEIERIAAIDKKVNSPVIQEILPHPVPPPIGHGHQMYPNHQFAGDNQAFMNPVQPGMQYHQPMMDFAHSGLGQQQQYMNMPPLVPISVAGATEQVHTHHQNTVQLQQHAVQLQQKLKQQHQSQNRNEDSKASSSASANKEVTKLFEEQKISLSDYLSVSAKPIDPATPINLHKKIKVISKCQEVIRILSDESRFSGRFIPKLMPPGSERQQESNTLKWKSPLRKVFPLRFMFTTPSKKTATQESVKTLLYKLLSVCDIPLVSDNKTSAKHSVNTAADSAASVTKIKSSYSGNGSYTDGIPLVQAGHHSVQVQAPVPVPAPKPVPPPISFVIKEQKPKPPITKSESAQTDPVTCQICEIRSAQKYTDSGTQTTDRRMEDESTQVTQEDLTKSSVIFAPRGILKNSGSVQSLSHLTPAQLLALKRDDNKEGSASSHFRHDSFPNSSHSLGGTNVGGRSLSTNSGHSSNPSFGMNYDQMPYSSNNSNMLSNNRGMGMGMNMGMGMMGMGSNDRPNNMFIESRNMNMMNEGDARHNMMMNQRQQDFGDPNFRSSGNIFGGQMPNRGPQGANPHNRNIFRSIWK